jgi:hypothetical protein
MILKSKNPEILVKKKRSSPSFAQAGLATTPPRHHVTTVVHFSPKY